jgi:predicted nucleic acid-binding Zn ribbon protein
MDSPFSPKGPRASTRKSDSSSLKEAIEYLLRVYKLQAKYDETYITAHWEEIMGKPIAARTQQVYVSNQKLFLKLDSAPLKKELMMAKQPLIELINKAAHQELIKEVVFL